VDTYGVDPKKLRKMGCIEVTKLIKSIQKMEENKDTYGLESIIRPYRP
jgi:hypothetical protein